MGNLLPFPRRLHRAPRRVQYDELRTLNTGEILAALTIKYPDLTFTADELDAGRGHRIHVEVGDDDQWQVRATPKS